MARLRWPTCSRGPGRRGYSGRVASTSCWACFRGGAALGGTARAASFRLGVGALAVRWYRPERRFSCDDGLGGGTLFGGDRTHDSLAQFMVPMEDVGCGMRPEVMGDRGQQAWRLVARRLDDVALERSQGGLQQGAPRVLIRCLGRLLQPDRVADRLNRYEAKATGKGFILGGRDILRHHSLRQALVSSWR